MNVLQIPGLEEEADSGEMPKRISLAQHPYQNGGNAQAPTLSYVELVGRHKSITIDSPGE